MATITMPLPNRISPGIKIDTEFNRNTTKFGFGTEQTVTKGLRPIRHKISVSWDALSAAELAIVKPAIDQQINQPSDRISYALPDEPSIYRLWVVTSLSKSYPDVGYTSLSVEFREVYI